MKTYYFVLVLTDDDRICLPQKSRKEAIRTIDSLLHRMETNAITIQLLRNTVAWTYNGSEILLEWDRAHTESNWTQRLGACPFGGAE